MKHSNTARMTWQILTLVVGIALSHFLTAAPSLATRKAAEDVKSPSVRMRAGLMPKQNLLFNVRARAGINADLVAAIGASWFDKT